MFYVYIILLQLNLMWSKIVCCLKEVKKNQIFFVFVLKAYPKIMYNYKFLEFPNLMHTITKLYPTLLVKLVL